VLRAYGCQGLRSLPIFSSRFKLCLDESRYSGNHIPWKAAENVLVGFGIIMLQPRIASSHYKLGVLIQTIPPETWRGNPVSKKQFTLRRYRGEEPTGKTGASRRIRIRILLQCLGLFGACWSLWIVPQVPQLGAVVQALLSRCEWPCCVTFCCASTSASDSVIANGLNF
jgi:hypothetical protein